MLLASKSSVVIFIITMFKEQLIQANVYMSLSGVHVSHVNVSMLLTKEYNPLRLKLASYSTDSNTAVLIFEGF